MLFSATMPREVVAIAKRHMRNYETIATSPTKKAQQLTDQIFIHGPPARQVRCIVPHHRCGARVLWPGLLPDPY